MQLTSICISGKAVSKLDIKPTVTKTLNTGGNYVAHLLMPLYRFVPYVPVIHSFLAAETADTIRRTNEVETSPCQSLSWHLLHQVGVAE